MKWIFWLFSLLFFSIFLWHLLTKKYLNPNKLRVFIGKKGCGKSTLYTKDAATALRRGRTVYGNEPVSITVKRRGSVFRKTSQPVAVEVRSTKKLVDPSKPYLQRYEPGSLILIDEASLINGYDNRQFKSMDPKTIEWYRLQRHYRVAVNLYTQSWDIDKKLRSLTDEFFLCNKVLRVFAIARRIIMKPIIVHPTGETAAHVADDFIEDGLLLAPFGGMRIAFIPRWVKLFDSFKT